MHIVSKGICSFISSCLLTSCIVTSAFAYTPEMKSEGPDWSGYTQEEFENIEFENFADGIIPISSLNDEQAEYLNSNYSNVIYDDIQKEEQKQLLLSQEITVKQSCLQKFKFNQSNLIELTNQVLCPYIYLPNMKIENEYL